MPSQPLIKTVKARIKEKRKEKIPVQPWWSCCAQVMIWETFVNLLTSVWNCQLYSRVGYCRVITTITRYGQGRLAKFGNKCNSFRLLVVMTLMRLCCHGTRGCTPKYLGRRVPGHGGCAGCSLPTSSSTRDADARAALRLVMPSDGSQWITIDHSDQ